MIFQRTCLFFRGAHHAQLFPNQFYLTFSIYIEILGTFRLEIPFEWQVGPTIRITPKPFDKVGIKSPSGIVSLQLDGLICEHKGGFLGVEGKQMIMKYCFIHSTIQITFFRFLLSLLLFQTFNAGKLMRA